MVRAPSAAYANTLAMIDGPRQQGGSTLAIRPSRTPTGAGLAARQREWMLAHKLLYWHPHRPALQYSRWSSGAAGTAIGRTATGSRNEKEDFHEAYYRNHQAVQAG